MPKCNQVGCLQQAAYRYTWPGKSEETICAGHAAQVASKAQMIGLHVRMILLGPQDFGARRLQTPGKSEIET